MRHQNRRYFSLSEKVSIMVSVSISNLLYELNNLKGKNLTLKELLDQSGLTFDSKNSNFIKEKANHKVSGICRAGSRFSKDCICIQQYTDAPEMMEWAISNNALFTVSSFDIGIEKKNIQVHNPYEVWAKFCSVYRKKSKASAIAITGSIGKTTAKQMMYAVFSQAYKTLCDFGNDNQIDGIGMVSQHIPSNTEKWIVEVSEDTKGIVKYVSEILTPEIVVITSIDKSHIEEFDDEADIIREVYSITSQMRQDGIIICSKDEPYVPIDGKKTILVSINSTDADYYATNIIINREGLKFKVNIKQTSVCYDVQLNNIYAIHNIYPALFAFAAGVESKIPHNVILQGLQSFRTTGIRQNIYKDKGVLVYADCYNAVAKSIKSALDACCVIPIQGKRIAVLGDVAECGAFSDSMHDEIIRMVDESTFDYLFIWGNNLQEASRRVSVRKSLNIRIFETRSNLNAELKKLASKGDIVLFKASHSGRLDLTIKKYSL